MKKLIESILTDSDSIIKNVKVRELINLLANSSEKQFSNFLKEYEEIRKRLETDKKGELLEFISKEVDKIKVKGQEEGNLNGINKTLRTTTPPPPIIMNSSCTASPEKQSGGSRWIVPREERRKILEQIERAREDQKRKKKKDWCRLDQMNEFEEIWNEGNGLRESDLEIIRIDEGLVKVPEIKKFRITPENNKVHNNHDKHINTNTNGYNCEFTIVDFDCIENLLIEISRSNSEMANAAKSILNYAENVYKSDLMFYFELRDFDQPFFAYYVEEDDLRALKYYDFEEDDLGRFVRMKSFLDKSRKFYRERAYRHRYISRKPFHLFFTESVSRKLRGDVEFLEKKSKEFRFWVSEIISKRNVILVSGNPLLKAFSLFLIFSLKIETLVITFDLSKLIWSYAKFGTEWTLKEILKTHGKAQYLTLETRSKLSCEAEQLRLKFV